MTNREKLDQLESEIRTLNLYIEKSQLEDKYDEFLRETLNNVDTLKPLKKEEWDIMLPKEKERNLYYYYWCCRTEYSALIGKMREEAEKAEAKNLLRERIDKWLNNTWVRVGLTLIELSSFAIAFSEICVTANNEEYHNANINPDWRITYKYLVEEST